MADASDGDRTGCRHRYHKEPDGSFTCESCDASFRTEATPGGLDLDLRDSPGAVAERRRRSTDRWATVISRVIRFIVPWSL